ncbi:hypothetical protein SKAU_G00252900 [Synaphobranchus kaupii]|uniref:Uncharacterized protein n=1 Tax=Synaphobranchus kaupii TaxID=118154 RepID=A0A9Q1F375_SYNKA|nr:hypothetical protein SKAU_G00252900 [Synaphobranchus kaupii]
MLAAKTSCNILFIRPFPPALHLVSYAGRHAAEMADLPKGISYNLSLRPLPPGAAIAAVRRPPSSQSALAQSGLRCGSDTMITTPARRCL